MKSSMDSLLDAIRNKNQEMALQWKEQEVWCTLETLIAASSSSAGYVLMIIWLANWMSYYDSVANSMICNKLFLIL